MSETILRRTIGSLIDEGVIEATTGFPFGGHNDADLGVPHIRPFNVTTTGDINLKQIKSIPEQGTLRKPRLSRNDILFNNTNTKELVGKCALWDQDLETVFSNHMTRIRILKAGCDPGYLAFAILHHWMIGKSEMLARAHVAQASIIGERFREIEIPWFDGLSQSHISRTLRLVRQACQLESRQLQLTQELKCAIMRQLFSKGLHNEQQKESDVGLIPESWLIESLSDHFSTVSGGTPSRGNPVYWEGGKIPWVKTTEVDYCVITETGEHITPAGLKNSAAKLLAPGTLLMAMYGQGVTRGKVAILGIEAACNQACAAISPKDKAIDTRFLYYFLTHQYEEIRQLAHGGQQQNLNSDIVRGLPIAYPTNLNEQEEIIEILSVIDKKLELHSRIHAVFEDLFKALLQKLMVGDIHVSELNIPDLAEEAVLQEVAV